MKKRITVEQLKELGIEERYRLRQWWKPQIGDLYYLHGIELVSVLDTSEIKTLKSIKEGSYPILDIGQMIEFLNDQNKDIFFNLDCTIPVCSLCVDGDEYRKSNITDALWEAVKAIL
jgi:hypothetical protein